MTQTSMSVKERPILLGTPWVKAILAGRKTQTRRAIFRDGDHHMPWRCAGTHWQDGDLMLRCPFGKPGDRLWVRESAYIAPPNFGEPGDGNATDYEGRPRVVGYAASMDGEAVRCAEDYGVKKTPSIHVPRWASRIDLEVTEVRVERLQAISKEDAIAEGLYRWSDPPRMPDTYYGIDHADVWETDPRKTFARLWDQLGAHQPCPWVDDPWVWVVSFRRIES